MKKRIMRFMFLVCIVIVAAVVLMGCSSSETSPTKGTSESPTQSTEEDTSSSDSVSAAEHDGPPRDHTPQVLVPTSPGTLVQQSDVATIDYSNASDGYFTIDYFGGSEKAKMTVTGPDAIQYVYLISGIEGVQVYPLTAGSGLYMVSVLEVVNPERDEYAMMGFAEVQADIADEFSPALYPSQYVNFHSETQAVIKSAELSKDQYSDLDVVNQVYSFVIEHVSYDAVKAQTVQYGYLPIVDETLETGMGICFDYAALMSAMLRSQGIPTRLIVGFSGQVYHAWINTYITDVGWVDGIIQFDGSGWTLVDPTLGANNDREEVEAFIGQGAQYSPQFVY